MDILANLNTDGSATNATTGEKVTASLSGKTNIIAKGENELELATGGGKVMGIAGKFLGVGSLANDLNNIYNKEYDCC